jgi:hypothetical protein
MNLVLVITIYDFLSWLIFLCLPRLRYSFISQRIETHQSITAVRTGMHAFVYDYMQQDGFLILRLIHANVGDEVTTSILTNLWRNFQRADKPASGESASANIGATISLTATGNRGLYTRQNSHGGESIFDYSKSSTNL